MVSKARLNSAPSSPNAGYIEFSEPRGLPGRDDFRCTATFAFEGEESSVGLDMIDAYRADMLGFFEELAASADGWRGVKRWESEFSEMHIWATNRSDGVVILEVLIRWPPKYEDRRSGTIHVDAEALPEFASRMRSFLRMPEGGERFKMIHGR